jgi:hypothetical protein
MPFKVSNNFEKFKKILQVVGKKEDGSFDCSDDKIIRAIKRLHYKENVRTTKRKMDIFISQLVTNDHVELKDYESKGYGLIARKVFKDQDHIPLTGWISNSPAVKENKESTIDYPRPSKTYRLLRGRCGVLDGPAYFLNHSCSANATAQPYKIKGGHTVVIKARRTIQIGEEITIHYGKNFFKELKIKCCCGSCNGIVRQLK